MLHLMLSNKNRWQHCRNKKIFCLPCWQLLKARYVCIQHRSYQGTPEQCNLLKRIYPERLSFNMVLFGRVATGREESDAKENQKNKSTRKFHWRWSNSFRTFNAIINKIIYF